MNTYLCITLAFISTMVCGQSEELTLSEKKSYLRFGIGITHTRMIDEGYTDRRYLFRGTNAKFSLAYGRETPRSIFNFYVDASVGDLESKQGELPSEYYFAEPTIEWLRHTTHYTTFGKMNKLFLGAQLSSFNQGIGDEKVVDNIRIFSLHGMYFNVLDRFRLTEKHYFQVHYSMPVIVYENSVLWNSGASKYTTHDLENVPKMLTDNGTFTYFNAFNNVQVGVDYVLKAGRSTNLLVKYNFVYVKSHVESRLGFYNNDVMLELKIGL